MPEHRTESEPSNLNLSSLLLGVFKRKKTILISALAGAIAAAAVYLLWPHTYESDAALLVRYARFLRGNPIAYCAKASASAWTNQRQFQRVIYLDYNATTPLCEPARTAMLPFLGEKFGNPSSVHAAGREARAAIDDARDRLAELLGAKAHELIFTSGG